MSNDKITEVGVNIQEKATVIWNIANALFGYFKPHEYGLVILPMTVVKRFHDCLLPTHAAVREQYEKVKKLAVIDGFLTRASGYQFYNTSKYTFDLLLSDPDNIEANFRDYLAGFSPNVQDVLAKFDFDNIIKRMVECNSLYLVIKEFASPKGYLGPDKIGAVDCGYIFEDLVRRFSESYDEEAGAHFTSRDIIYLMTDILLSDADLTHAGNVTVYDMAMGTSQMLSCMEERIHDLNEEIEVTCFGQELNRVVGRQRYARQLRLISQLADKEGPEDRQHRPQIMLHLLLFFLFPLVPQRPVGEPEKGDAGHRLNDSHIQIIAQRRSQAHRQQIQHNSSQPGSRQNMGNLIFPRHRHQKKLRLVSHFRNKDRRQHRQKNHHFRYRSFL